MSKQHNIISSLGFIDKRFRFVIASFGIMGLMLFSSFFFFDTSWFFLPLLCVATYVLTYFAILEGIEKVEWLMLFLVPLLLTLSFYLFYVLLLPGRWLTRVPFIIIYGISMYAILLCSNIFNVGVEKSLQLYRAAFSVNFFYQALITFLLFSIVLSFRFNFFINALLAGGIVFLFSFQLLWTLKLNAYFEKINLTYALFLSLAISEITLILSLMPLQPAIFALFLTAVYYSLSGLIMSYLDQRLFKETVREYLTVLGFVAVIIVLSLIGW